MDTPYKILITLVAGVLALSVFYYFIFQVPVSPEVLIPGAEENAVDIPPSPAVQQGGSSANIPQSVISGGSYSRILGEADLDKSLFDAEVIDANSVAGDKSEFLSAGQSYDENNLPFSDFCANLPDFSKNTTEKIESREAAVKSKRAELLNKMISGRKERDAVKNSYKLQLSLMQDEYFARLQKKASGVGRGPDAEKFISLVIDALAVKRTGGGSVTQTFRSGIDEAFLARTGLINTAISAYKNSAIAALDKAKSSCNAGGEVSAIRTDLRTELNAAKTRFNSDYAAAGKLSTAILPLIEQRKATMQSVLSTFRASLDNARKDLKMSYPQAE